MLCCWCGSRSHHYTRCPYPSKEAAERANAGMFAHRAARLYCTICRRYGHTANACPTRHGPLLPWGNIARHERLKREGKKGNAK